MVLDISLVFSAVRHLVVRVLCDVPLYSQLLLASAIKDTKVSKPVRRELFIMPISFRPKSLLSHEEKKKKKSNGIEASGPAGLNPTNNSRSALRVIHLQVSNPRIEKKKKGRKIM